MSYSAVAKRHQKYGKGKHVIEIDEIALARPEDLKQKLIQIFASEAFKPPVLPTVAFELMELSRRTNINLSEVRVVLERDPMVASSVLKVAQSPIYATRVGLRSLEDAVCRLGLHGVRDVVWQVVMKMRVFRVPGYDHVMSQIQSHCVATGHIARAVCGYTSIANDYAFLCGLLHDVGICGVLIAISDNRPKAAPDLDLLWPTIDEIHAACGGHMAKMWKLAPDIQIVLAEHHRFDPSNMPHPLVATITVAERLAQDAGWPALSEALQSECGYIDVVPDSRFDAACDALGLTPGTIDLIRADVERLREQLGPGQQEAAGSAQ